MTYEGKGVTEHLGDEPEEGHFDDQAEDTSAGLRVHCVDDNVYQLSSGFILEDSLVPEEETVSCSLVGALVVGTLAILLLDKSD
ncbi:hypothetical protein NDU88_004328 [Pleurodeles waltl]|uniref:Uncharacterized protein n=1 Tax=Pleurodeles waltl TaxID=8319 RepID=A0AAV7NLW8_PLEWA|nr:hypothetical protein NDU88_004328 [Pleurodeles waltl]